MSTHAILGCMQLNFLCVVRRVIFLFFVFVGLIACTSCASLPTDVQREPSAAIPIGGDSALDKVAIATTTAHGAPDQSGFRLLHMGPTSLHARMELIRRAERSLDLQYYHIHNDPTGRMILRGLRDAAARGVRVRLLVDDMYTTEVDDLLLALVSHPHVSVRLFNPFAARGSRLRRFALSLLDFDRVNRRMHNKLLVADGAIALTGGRNIGDAYHGYSDDTNFIDFEMVAVGPVVGQMEGVFDTYWNSPQVYPLHAIVPPSGDLAADMQSFDVMTNASVQAIPLPQKDLLGKAPLAVDLDGGRLDLAWGMARYVADPPAKITGKAGLVSLYGGSEMSQVRGAVSQEIRKAKTEVVVTSPYLVPGQETLQRMRALSAQGVKQSLLTNSYRSTDEPVVHTGYRRYRDDMLLAGIDLFELSPEDTRRIYSKDYVPDHAWFRWHAKSVIVDQQTLVMGSINFDPRSDRLNTEAGLIVHSPEIARGAHQLVTMVQRIASWQLRMDPSNGGLQWVGTNARGEKDVQRSEPGLDFWNNVKLNFQSLIVPEWIL